MTASQSKTIAGPGGWRQENPRLRPTEQLLLYNLDNNEQETNCEKLLKVSLILASSRHAMQLHHLCERGDGVGERRRGNW